MLRLPSIVTMAGTAGLLLLPVLALSQPNQTGSSQEKTPTSTSTPSGPLGGQAAARDASQGRSQVGGSGANGGGAPSTTPAGAPAVPQAPTRPAR